MKLATLVGAIAVIAATATGPLHAAAQTHDSHTAQDLAATGGVGGDTDSAAHDIGVDPANRVSAAATDAATPDSQDAGRDESPLGPEFLAACDRADTRAMLTQLRAFPGHVPAQLVGVCGNGRPCALRALDAVTAASDGTAASYASFSLTLVAGASPFERDPTTGASAFTVAVERRDTRAIELIGTYGGCPGATAQLQRHPGSLTPLANFPFALADAAAWANPVCAELIARAETGSGVSDSAATRLRGLDPEGLVKDGACDGTETMLRLGLINARTLRAVVAAIGQCEVKPRFNARDSDANRTTLHWAAHGGDTATVNALLTSGVEESPRDVLLRTPLYEAAAAGHVAVAQQLLSAARTPEYIKSRLDIFSRLPTTVAALAHPTRHPAMSSLLRPDKPVTEIGAVPMYAIGDSVWGERGTVDELAGVDAAVALSVTSSGWRRYNGVAPAQFAGTCDLIEVAAENMNAHRFLRDFHSLRRPVMVRGAAAHFKATETWTRKAFESNFDGGHMSLNGEVGEFPGAAAFGRPVRQLPLSDYVAYMFAQTGTDAAEAPPPEYFVLRPALDSAVLQDVDLHLSFFRDAFLEVQDAAVHLGPPGSGTPFHSHTHAASALIHGRKEWYLTPPTELLTSRVHPREWSQQVLPFLNETAAPLHCVQRPGDVLYIPDYWSHSVLNLEDTVAVSTTMRPALYQLQ